MSHHAISETQTDRGTCWNVVSGPLRADVPDLRTAGTLDHREVPCLNAACWRHGTQPPRDLHRAAGTLVRQRLQQLARKRAAPTGAAAPMGGRDATVPARGM